MKIVVNLIKAKPSDIEITYQIMCNSLKPYLAKLWDWDEVHQQKLHKKKFRAPKTSLIDFQEKIIGYIVLSERDTEIYIDNLLIDRTFQNLGIGKEVMRSVIRKSSLEKKPIRLQVFKVNTKAQRFYRNLGFEKSSENEFNFEMERPYQNVETSLV